MDAFYKQILIVAVTIIAVLVGVLAYKWIIAETNSPRSDNFGKSNPQDASGRHVMRRNESDFETRKNDMSERTKTFSVKTPMQRDVQMDDSSNESVTDSSCTVSRESQEDVVDEK